MGMLKNWLFTFYEPLLDAFEEEHGRYPNDDEDAKLWDSAMKEAQDSLDARMEALKEAE